MPYDPKKQDTGGMKYPVRFRGCAMIPRINQMAPCRMELTLPMIETILESLHTRPRILEVYYVDANGKEWEINYGNFKKIIPTAKNRKPEPVHTMTPEEIPQANHSSTPDVSKEEISDPAKMKSESDDTSEKDGDDTVTNVADMSDREMEAVVLEDETNEEENDPTEVPPQYQSADNNQYQNRGKHNHRRH